MLPLSAVGELSTAETTTDVEGGNKAVGRDELPFGEEEIVLVVSIAVAAVVGEQVAGVIASVVTPLAEAVAKGGV